MRAYHSAASVMLLVSACGSAVAGPNCRLAWHPDPVGTPGTSAVIRSMIVFDDGHGPALYAGGPFATAGGITVNSIAKWNGGSWQPLGTGAVGPVPGLAAAINGLGVFDDGRGPALYAAGNLLQAGGVPVNRIARWDGVSWSALGAGLNQGTQALASFNDGSGNALYVGGAFTMAASVPGTAGIARWNGSQWSAVGGGMVGACNVLLAYDDGTGPALYAGGTFTSAGGVANTSCIARWNGTGWASVGGGITGADTPRVNSLCVYDDGMGPALYAGGLFRGAGDAAVSNLAKWKNGQWSDVGGGTSDNILKLAAFNHPSGAGLYVGGTFTGVGPGGSVPANEVARWDGQGWTALDVGVSHPTVATVGAMAVYDDGRGQSLFIAGGFTTAGGLPAGNIARWGCDPCYANCDGSTAAPVLNVNDFICFQNKYAAGDSGANCDGSTIPPVLNVNDFVCFQTRYAQGCP